MRPSDVDSYDLAFRWMMWLSTVFLWLLRGVAKSRGPS